MKVNPGVKVIAISLKSVTGADAAEQTATAFYRANWQSVADGFVDIQDDPLLGANGASANTTWFAADGTHLTDAGYARVAQYFANAANKLCGSSSTSYNTTQAATYQMLPTDGFLLADNSFNAQVITLPDCIAYSGSFVVKAGTNGSNAVTIVNKVAAETVDGVNLITTPMTLTAKSKTSFLVVPGPMATGGCTWSVN